MCKLPTTKSVIRKGDIVRIKANDGCLIGDYYIVVDASNRQVSYLRKIDNGRVQEDKEYIFCKNKLGVVKTISLRVSNDIITSITNSMPSCIRLNYSTEAEKAIKTYEQANKTCPINIVVMHNTKGEKLYVQFTSMMKTTKLVEYLGEERAIPHLTLFNLILC